MEFSINIGESSRKAEATNIYSLAHLGIADKHRMVIMISGKLEELKLVSSRVSEIALAQIKFLAVVDHNQEGKAKEPDFRFHYSLTSSKNDLEAIRKTLGIIGEDEEEEIEDFDDEEGMNIEELKSLKLYDAIIKK